MPHSFLDIHEEFIVQRLKEMERNLDKEAVSPYRITQANIIRRIRKIFSMYEKYPDALKYHMIQQEFTRQRVFPQIQQRYGDMGREFTVFLKGSLKLNFQDAIKHARTTLKDVKKDSKHFEIVYQETNDIQDVWRKRTINQSNKVLDIINQGIRKHNTVDMITEKLVKETDLQIYQAQRLARTELSRVLNEASLTVYKEKGLTHVKWLDSTEQIILVNRKGNAKTQVCEHCRKYATGGRNKDGIYPINNLPANIPAHPNCRCTLGPVIKN